MLRLIIVFISLLGFSVSYGLYNDEPPAYSVNLQKQLRDTERQARDLEARLNKTRQALLAERLKLSRLSQEELELQQRLATKKSLLAKQVVLSYRTKETSLLHAILAKQSLQESEKIHAYLHALNDSQVTLAQEVKGTLTSLEYIKRDLQIQTAKLEKLYASQLSEQKKLSLISQERHALLAAVG